MSNKDIIQELKELDSLLAGLPAQNIYAVPEGYFERLEGQVLARIRNGNEGANSIDEGGKSTTISGDVDEELTLLSTFLSKVPRVLPFTAPNGYFEGLENRLVPVIDQRDYQTADEELSSISPFLSGIGKQNPYTVPQGYFENFENNINLKPLLQPAAKVVSMVNRKWFRYAAAAIVVGFIAVTGIRFLTTDPGQISNPHAWVEQNMNKVSTDDINNFIQTADEGSSDLNSIATTTTDIKDLMNDVSDKDIQDFLNKTAAGNEDTDADILN